MISREDLVGTVMRIGCRKIEDLTNQPEDVNDTEFLLVNFLGEGTTAVVYGVVPLEDPSKAEKAMKLFKPRPFLEMSVLHHSFRVYEKLYPNHPLLMQPQERMRRLTEEMVTRLLSPRFEFRVEIYRNIMETAIQGLARQYAQRYEKGELVISDLLEDPAVTPRLDENLLYCVRQLLDEDSIVREYVPFFEFLVDAIPKLIERWKHEGSYSPFSSNVLYNLLGLKIEDFINDEELDHIAGDPRLLEQVSYRRIEDLWQFVTILYSRAVNIINLLSAERTYAGPKGSDDLSEEMGRLDIQQMEANLSSHIRAAVSACRLVERFASSADWNNSRLRALARRGYRKTLRLEHRASKLAKYRHSALT